MGYYYWIDRNYDRQHWQAEAAHLERPLQEAYYFQKYLETIPLEIKPDDRIAGWFGYENTNAPEGLVEFFNNIFLNLDEDMKKQTPEAILNRDYCFSASGYDVGHNLMDYKTVLSRGTRAYIKDAEENLKNFVPGSKQDITLKAMIQALQAGEILSLRYADLAKEMAAQTEDHTEKERLLKIEQICRKVPMYPPEDFHEAVQAIFLLYMLDGTSDIGWGSISFGNFDQYMYPYYQKSKEIGCTDEEIEVLLMDFYKKLDSYSGQDAALSIGGVDANGQDATNELSYRILAAEKKSLLRAPLLAARINKNTPDQLMYELIDSRLFEIGQPSFYSEEGCKEAILGRGDIDEENAPNYQIHACMQLEIPGDSATLAWGICTNLHLPLELALNNGKPIHGELPITLNTPPKKDYQNVDEIFDQYRLYLDELFHHMIGYVNQGLYRRLGAPNPWLSALTPNGIKLGLDRWDGGSKYLNVVVENFAFANAADAIGAIEQLVFDEKKYTIDMLLEAAAHNYEGYEDIRSDILKCPKYGMNVETANQKARRVLSIIADICEENREGCRIYLPSLHTLNEDAIKGKRLYATLDGRLAGTPVNKNAGPANEARTSGPTAEILSACCLNQKRFSGGQALDVHFSFRNMDDPEKKKKIASLIRLYLANGGLQMQVNALRAETLKKAYDNPEQYRNLIVRIGGHSKYFNDLPDEVKLEFIDRFGKEERSAW